MFTCNSSVLWRAWSRRRFKYGPFVYSLNGGPSNLRFFAFVFALIGGSAPARADRVQFACHDVVVIGKVSSTAYHGQGDPNDPIGYGQIDASVSINRVLHGSTTRQSVPITYFAHTFMRNDRDFVLVLRLSKAGIYSVVDARRVYGRLPPMAARCTARAASLQTI